MKRIFLCLIGILLLTGCQKEEPITRSNLALDTVVSITLYENGSEEILDSCYDIINNYDTKLNAFSDSSVLSNIGPEPIEVEPDIYDLIQKNVDYYNQTNGLFSPVLGKLIKLWNIHEPEVKEPPTTNEVAEALQHIDINNLVLENQTVALKDPEEKLNLGASTKGFIADKLKEYLKTNGINNALINLGGNILLIGNKNGEDFTVGIENPDGGEGPIATLELQDKSIVTSGDYQRYFTDHQGTKFHHILNPKTGYPERNDLRQVTVISDSSLDGDILSTALFLMGSNNAKDFLRTKDGIQAIMVTNEDEIYVSEELKENFELAEDYTNNYRIIYF